MDITSAHPLSTSTFPSATSAATAPPSGIETSLHAGRRDGRTRLETRAISLSQGILSRADGSARVKVGHTDVLVAIYGPICAPQTKQDAEMAHIHVSYRACDAEGSKRTDVTAAKQLQVLIEDVVIRALYPRRGVVVAVEVLSEDGGVAAAVVNAVCVALMDAGVPMRSVPVAAAVAVCNGVVVVDAAKIEESEAQAVITFTFDTSARPSSRAFMAVHTVGDCGGELIFNEALSTCSEIADKTIAFLNLCLRQRTSQQYIWNS